jgi:hypothetical protein
MGYESVDFSGPAELGAMPRPVRRMPAKVTKPKRLPAKPRPVPVKVRRVGFGPTPNSARTHHRRRGGGLGALLDDATVAKMTEAQNKAIQAAQAKQVAPLTTQQRLDIIAGVQKSYGLDPKFQNNQTYDPKRGQGTFVLDSVVGEKPQTNVFWDAAGRQIATDFASPVGNAAAGFVSGLLSNPFVLAGGALALYFITRKKH